jgi:hypothetical protein
MTRDYATYYGGSDDETILSIYTDNQGNTIVCGQTDSPDNIASADAWQPTPGGEGDAFLAKFDPSGTRLWGTYFGGPSPDVSWCCRTDSTGNIYLSGHTLSPTGIASPGAHQTILKGERDAFLAKFSPEGTLLWATYYGGSEQEAGYGCDAKPSGVVCLTGYTNSSNFIATPGTHQQSHAGETDGFLAMFDASGQRIWGTYYGGALNDAGAACLFNQSGTIFLSGSSISPNGIATPGAHQEQLGGDMDAILATFSSNGALIWGTYCGGNYGDYATGITRGQPNTLYITGYTQSTNNMATPDTHQESLAGATDGFLERFDTNGLRIWGTYYGGESMDEIRGVDGFQSNDFDNESSGCLINGYTWSFTGISSLDAYQPNCAGGRDAFLARIDTTGNRIWGTYYGGTCDDYGYGCAINQFQPQTHFLLVGHTGSLQGMTTPNGWQTEYGGSMRDGFLANFYETPVGIREKEVGDLLISPNPTKGKIQVSGKNLMELQWHLEIYNTLGNKIFETQNSAQNVSSATNQINLDVGHLPPGMYFVYYKSTNQQRTQKLIIIH